MAELLISVRNRQEARAALRGGAGIIDVKEPTAGALGAATPDVWREVLAEVNGARPVSAALGELHEWNSTSHLRARATAGMTFAKIGLAKMNSSPHWPDQWRDVQQSLPEPTSLVAVMYADWQVANSPAPLEILEQCSAMKCRWALLDTFDKSGGSLFQHFSDEMLAELIERAHAFSMRIVIAGSLALSDFPRVIAHAPDLIGIRGAACADGRNGHVAEKIVHQLSSGLRDFLALKMNHRKKHSSIA